MRKLEEMNKPVIARINGNAFGGGVGLICCADIAIASTDCTLLHVGSQTGHHRPSSRRS
jgi:enoyl-CoA hydratase/carnithine racemase